MISLGLAAALTSPLWASPVVGGWPADPADWPATAAVMRGGQPSCTGVLIAEDLVLTAAHCLSPTPEAVLVGVAEPEAPGEVQPIPVERALAFPDHRETLDAGLLWLSAPSQAVPAELALGCASLEIADGAQATLLGYGSTRADGTGEGGVLMEAALEIVDADCDDLDRGCNPEVSPGGELLAGGDGVDSCNGDSGGPLYVWSRWGVPYLAATVARAAWPAEVSCGDGGIYVRVDALEEWLAREAGLILEEPDCEQVPNLHPPELEATRISLRANGRAVVRLTVSDADGPTQHAFALLEVPEQMSATVDAGGDLRVEDHAGVARSSGVLVEVSDGVHRVEATLPVEVSAPPSPPTPAEPRRSCASSSGRAPLPWSGLALSLAVVVARAARARDRRWRSGRGPSPTARRRRSQRP